MDDGAGVIVYGREFSAALIDRLKGVDVGLSRRAVARQLCRWLDWKGPSGKWQETNARMALDKLQQAGVLQLPAARGFAKARRGRRRAVRALASPQLNCSLAQLGGVELVLVESRHSRASRECQQLLESYHPLGSRLCGAQLRYLIRCAKGTLGVLCFSAAARRLRPRDQWIGWSDTARRENLHFIVNNSRFLIVPGVQVKHLASHVLAKVVQRLAQDWQKRYDYKPLLVETFVEQKRYTGTSYRASNWSALEEPTAGRGRNDGTHAAAKTLKRIFLYALGKKVQQRLCQLPEQLRLAQPAAKPVPPQAPALDWVQEEWGQADLGDGRLNHRLLTLGRDFYARPQGNVAHCCNGDKAKTKAAYRFFEHPQVTMKAVLQSHYQATAQRMAKETVVVVPQDTTFLNYSTHPATENLGLIGSQAKGLIGLVVHDTMAFNLAGTPLGLVDVQCWARDPEQFGKKHKRRELEFEEKESVKWLRSLEALERIQKLCPQTQIISIGDREADVYELFVWGQQPGRPALLIRANHNRRLRQEHGYLWEAMAARDVAAIKELRLPRTPKRTARTARLEVRFGPVTLRAPKTRAKLPDVKLWAVWACEVDPPKGAEAVEWMLQTNLPVETIEQANQILEYYARRWGIEVFHKTLKSGCQIESRQLGSADRIEACLAIDMVVAWRIFHLTKLGRETPDVPCTVYFEDIQWQALVGFINKDPIPPPLPPSLRDAIRMLASLGGFLGRASDGEPGTQTIWLGLQRLDDIGEAWKVFSQMATASSNKTYG